MKLLYEIEGKYRDALNDAIYKAESGCTLKEFLELGFNNATLLNPFEEDTDKKDIYDLYKCAGGKYSIDLTEEMLNVRVVLSSTYEDFDFYTCANIELENKNDWKLFEKLEVN